MYQLISTQRGGTPARSYTHPPRGETERFRLAGLLQENLRPWEGALTQVTQQRLIGTILLTDERLLIGGNYWVSRKPAAFWKYNDILVGGSNYADRAAQFVQRRDAHAAGQCLLECITAVQLERPDSQQVREGYAPNLGFVTFQGDSTSCVSIMPTDKPAPPWGVYLEQAQSVVRFIATVRARNNQVDDALQQLMSDAHYDSSGETSVGWEFPYSMPVSAAP